MEALRLFLALRLYRPSWAGALLLGVGLDGPGRALALGSLAAGAAGLFVEDDPALLRQAQREGCCSFSVTTLEEAIRILKNEVRQGRAIAVALRSVPAAALEEMLRSGLQPEAFAFSRTSTELEQACARLLRQRGAHALGGGCLAANSGTVDLDVTLTAALGSRWQLGTDVAVTSRQRQSRDAELLASSKTNDLTVDSLSGLAAEWLRVAPSLMPRSLSRPVLLPGLPA